MKNIIFTLLFVSLSLTSFAQNESMEKLMEDVSKLVSKNGSDLDFEDQALVTKNLKQILQVFRLNGYEVSSMANIICESGENKLINLDTQQVLHDFSSFNKCLEALANLKNGKLFCDFDDNSLHSTDGLTVYDFSTDFNCKEAIESIFKYKKFCDHVDNTLRKANGVLLYDFSSKEECLRNLL